MRHPIRVMRGHDLTNEETKTICVMGTQDLTKIYNMTMTFREHLQRAILETCDLRLDTDAFLTIENNKTITL